jgi:energy-coupling factor transporter ATP-binding protein EcfA2
MTAAAETIVRVDDLWFRYPSGEVPVLKGVSLTIRRGEFIGIIGLSGAGKSTLCQAIAGIIPHSVPGEIEGHVEVLGSDVTAQQRMDVTARVGLVLQDPEAQIIGMTVAEDLAFGPENYEIDPGVIARRSARCLELVGLSGLMERDTYALSGGQKQRLAIASALMLEPDLLILDEPTSELDPLGKDQVFEVVETLRKEGDVTVVMVEHEVDRLVQLADRIVVVNDGRIVVDDAPLAVFSRPDVRERTAGERLPAASELLGRLAASGSFPPIPPTLDLGEALRRTAAVLGGPHEHR